MGFRVLGFRVAHWAPCYIAVRAPSPRDLGRSNGKSTKANEENFRSFKIGALNGSYNYKGSIRVTFKGLFIRVSALTLGQSRRGMWFELKSGTAGNSFGTELIRSQGSGFRSK